MKLIFKKEGWYLEELSARYTAKITDNLSVSIWKCPYNKGFIGSFKSADGYELDEETCDFKADLYDGMTKKELVTLLEDYLSDAGYVNRLNESAKEQINRMAEFNNRPRT